MERKTFVLGLVFSFTAMLIPAAQQTKDKAAPAIEKADGHLVLEAVKFISPKKVIPCHYNGDFLWRLGVKSRKWA